MSGQSLRVLDKRLTNLSGSLWKNHTITAGIALAVAVVTFFTWRLGTLDAFIYRPQAEFSDLTVTFWPNIHYIQSSLKSSGQLPLWRTLIFSGSPFDIDPQSGLWYPPNLLFLFVPAALGFNLLFILHAVAGGLGMWIWARATGTSSNGALFASLAYVFAPKAIGHLGFGHVGLYYAAAYVPWILLGAYGLAKKNWRFVGLLGLASGFQLLANPQLAFYTGLVAGTYALGVIFSQRKSESFSAKTGLSALRLGVGFGLAGLVAAMQILPLLSFAPLSARAGLDFEGSAVSSVPAKYLLGFLLADHGGYMDYVFYVGIPVLVLALFGLRRRQAWFWWTFVVLAVIYSLGSNTPFYSWVFRLLPGLSWLRAPSRLWFIPSAVLALLSGWGLDNLIRGLRDSRRKVANLILVACALLAAGILLGYLLSFGEPPLNLVMFGLITPLTMVAILAIVNKTAPHWLPVTALFLILLADLWVMDSTLVEGRPREAVFAEGGLAAYLAGQSSIEPFRVYSPSYSLPRPLGALYGLESADGVDPLFLQSYDRFMQLASGVKREEYGVVIPAMEGDGPILTLNRGAIPDAQLLGLLNVKYVAAEFPLEVNGLRYLAKFGPTYLYENKAYLPRAYVVGDVQVVNGFDESLQWVQGHELAKSAAVQGGSSLASGEVRSQIDWIQRSPNRLELHINLDRRGFLILSQVWYPGWRVRVDGRSETVWKADGILDGVYLEAGNHNVTFTYHPQLLPALILLSLAGIAICVFILRSRSLSSIFERLRKGDN